MPDGRALPSLCTALLAAAVATAVPLVSAEASTVVRDGPARFEVVTPSLIRLEHAPGGRFETRPTQTAEGRLSTRPAVRTSVEGGWRVLRTSRLTLRWRRGSQGFGPSTLRASFDGRTVRPRLGPNPAPLGGWRRSLDHVDAPVPLHEGILSRAGWYLLDDSETAVIRGDRARARSTSGGYQDLYLFAYGRDYRRALRDLMMLTGRAPLLPRKAFGVWFSRWWPYGEADWREIAGRFRAERVPLDTLSVDTDFRAVHDPAGAAVAAALVGAPGEPYSWNAWAWNRELYPDPPRFFRWASEQEIEIGLNLHPSINDRDPRFEQTQARAGGGLVADDGCRLVQADPNGQCMVFDWADPDQLAAFFDLHEPFERDGADFWWLDWCCDGSRAEMAGLTPDTWINKKYFERQRDRGSRWPSFSRIGGSLQAGFGGRVGNGALAERRYSIQFTGDSCSTWPFLAFASQFTAAAASIGMPYVSHDIGSFFGRSPLGECTELSPFISPHVNELPPEMYVRWIQLGTFQPLNRLHSHHGERLPWEYPSPASEIAVEFLRLRGALVPHLYSLARESHDTGVPMIRPLYLQWPRTRAAYEHPGQFMLGRDLLVAPVARPGDPAEARVWFPPGTWTDWFTGERHRGPALKTLAVPLERMPVFVRGGGIVATQGPLATRARRPAGRLMLRVHRGDGETSIYDDRGEGLAYERGSFARTRVTQRTAGGVTTLRIGPARGSSPEMPTRRRWVVELSGVGSRPEAVRVAGRPVRTWSHDPRSGTVVVRAGARRTDRATTLEVGRDAGRPDSPSSGPKRTDSENSGGAAREDLTPGRHPALPRAGVVTADADGESTTAATPATTSARGPLPLTGLGLGALLLAGLATLAAGLLARPMIRGRGRETREERRGRWP